MRIRVAPKGRVERVDQRARLGGILSPVWYSVAMISYLLGLLLKKRLPLRQPCRGREALRLRGVPPRALPCRPKRRLSQAVADAYVLAAGSRHPSEPCPVSLRPQPDVCTGCVILSALSNPIINKQVATFADRRRDSLLSQKPFAPSCFRTVRCMLPECVSEGLARAGVPVLGEGETHGIVRRTC